MTASNVVPKKILVIEDNPVMQRLLKKWLVESGFDVIEAWDGKEGMELAEKLTPDAILMDVILPDGNGKKLTEDLKKNTKTMWIPVIFISNTVDSRKDRGKEKFLVSGKMHRAFAKPINQDRLLEALGEEMDKAQLKVNPKRDFPGEMR